MGSNSLQKGLYVESFDWSDPQFAPYKLDMAKLNSRQLDAMLSPDFDDICSPDPTTEEQMEMCRTIPCRVELFHSNVCNGVEKGWPKRMFNKQTFAELNRQEKRRVYRLMEKNGGFLYRKYVDEKRLAKRRRCRTSVALAPYYELQYRKNVFERITALANDDPAPGYDATIEQSVSLCDSSADSESNEAEDSQIYSLQTVINTGKSCTQQSRTAPEQIDLSDTDCHSDVVSENVDEPNVIYEASSRKTKTPYAATTDSMLDIGSECEVQSTNHNEYDFNMSDSESMTTVTTPSATPSRNDGSKTKSQRGDYIRIPDMSLVSLSLMTPQIQRASQQNELPDEDASEVDNSDVYTEEFLTQNVEENGITSTQQKQIQEERA